MQRISEQSITAESLFSLESNLGVEQTPAGFVSTIYERPNPVDVGRFIVSGGTEEDLIDAGLYLGFDNPSMPETAADVEKLQPFFQRVNDAIADQDNDSHVLFAGRDTEVLFDDFAIRYPEIRARLLPASKSLWSSPTMTDTNLSENFLLSYGIDAGMLESGAKYVLIDSGFAGSIGWLFGEAVKQSTGYDVLESGQLVTKLCCTLKGSLGTPITRFNKGEVPEISRFTYVEEGSTIATPDTFTIAVGMQLMPRFFGAYTRLAERDGRVIAVPQAEVIVQDIDRKNQDINESIVNPLAAAILQYRTVATALKQKR